MAAKKEQDKAKVTRIKASDSGRSASKPVATVPKETTKTVKAKTPNESKEVKEKKPNVLRRIGGYFKGAWEELRQVRWPNRRTTWSLTLAVILFTGFFVLLIILLDSLFSYIFNNIIV